MTENVHAKIFQEILDELHLWNFEYLADAAGISAPTLYNWYNGETQSPQLRTVVAVADALGYDLNLIRKARRLRAVS